MERLNQDLHLQLSRVKSIRDLIEEVAHWVPAQGPLKDFIHHNTLHAYQHLPFHEATRTAAEMTGARTYLPLDHYWSLYEQGKIHRQALQDVLFERTSGATDLSDLIVETKESLAAGFLEFRGRGVAQTGLRREWLRKHGVNLNLAVHPRLFRFVAQYLDQGLAIWPMERNPAGFWATLKDLVSESWAPFTPWSHGSVRKVLQLSPEEAIGACLASLAGSTCHWRRYLAEVALSHPGWSGLVRQVELSPNSLNMPRPISLMEFLAVSLTAEVAHLSGALKEDFIPITQGLKKPLALPVDEVTQKSSRLNTLLTLWHEGAERSYLLDVAEQLGRKSSSNETHKKRVQVYFCIDDRECSLRRHLEAQSPDYQTFGAAGFFAVDCFFRGAEEVLLSKHCPAPVQPKHYVCEVVEETANQSQTDRVAEFELGSKTLVRGFLSSTVLGWKTALELARSVFTPSLEAPASSSLRRLVRHGKLIIESDGRRGPDGLALGFTPAEMADRVQGLLKSTGFQVERAAPLVVFLGHGASSVNNPYFAAYDCGACSGKAGSINARAIAAMANHAEVRRILHQRGLVIPEDTYFVGGIHDTTRDEVEFFDTHLIPEVHGLVWTEFLEKIHLALSLNAEERVRKFEIVRGVRSRESAIDEGRQRSVSLFEPRPELNHATNAACLVGPRSWTQQLNFDRRAFLNSYDPKTDPTGDILASIFGAIVPVCGGINLEYFFSRVDPRVYGADSKLPQNVVGLFATMNGTEGDILTGLPTQMTELHPPQRLLIVVQQSPEIVMMALNLKPEIGDWVQNDWIRLACVDPEDHVFRLLRGGQWQTVHVGSGGAL